MSLRMIRLQKGLTQWDVAVKTAIPQTTISLYENGYKVPKDDDKRKLAKVLGCKLEDIYTVCKNPTHEGNSTPWKTGWGR